MRDYYPPGPVMDEFIGDDFDIRIVQGPVFSGKSVGVAMSLYKIMCQTPRWKSDKKRRSRMLVSRNTYPDLFGSTVETWLYWFPEDVYGRFKESEPYVHEMRFEDVECDVIFESYADDKLETIRALRSKEYTCAWYNEIQFAPKKLITEMIDRTGRYPPKEEIEHEMPLGLPQSFVGDLNAPPVDQHWINYMRGDVPLPLDADDEFKREMTKPHNWKFYKQPPALLEIKSPDGMRVLGYEVNPDAENLDNMADGVRNSITYDELARAAVAKGETPPRPHRYIEQLGGKNIDDIHRDLLCRTVAYKIGAPATPMFSRAKHVTSPGVEHIEGKTVVLGGDHGLTPAVAFMQEINGGWIVFDELVAFNMGTEEFAPLVKLKLAQRFPNCPYIAWGDPQGDWRSGNSAAKTNTPFKIYEANGVTMRAPALKDNPQARLEAMRKVMRTEMNGKFRFMIHPRCTYLIAACEGGAQIRLQKMADGTRLVEEIVKNSASHIFEACQYGLWGGGEVASLLSSAGAGTKKPINTIPKHRRLISLTRRR